MKTFVVVVNREAIIAFRAEDIDHALAIVNEEDGGLQLGLNGASGPLRADGKVLWDGESTLTTRRATDDEHKRWLVGRDAEIGDAAEGYQLDPKYDDLDEINDRRSVTLTASSAYCLIPMGTGVTLR